MKYLTIVLFLYGANAKSQSIVVAQGELSRAQSEARIHATRGRAYSDHILNLLRSQALEKKIVDFALELRKAELEKDNDLIYRNCNRAFEIRHRADWSPEDRAYFLRCLKRLNQLSSDPQKKYSLKVEAQAFSESANFKESSIPDEILENFKWLLINGRASPTAARTVELPQTRFRATFVSDKYEPVTRILSKEEFFRFSPKRTALISGSCKLGFRYESKDLSELEIEKTIVVAESCRRALTAHPIEQRFNSDKEKKFKFPKWAWWVAGGLVGYKILENNRQDRGGERPGTTTSGF